MTFFANKINKLDVTYKKPFVIFEKKNFFKKKDSLKSELFDGWNNTLMSKKDTKIFLKNYELFYKSKFEKNKIVGFIKNEKSWHNVDKFNLTKNYLRKSVNINLFLD